MIGPCLKTPIKGLISAARAMNRQELIPARSIAPIHRDFSPAFSFTGEQKKAFLALFLFFIYLFIGPLKTPNKNIKHLESIAEQ
jgi:hypothetical protein